MIDKVYTVWSGYYSSHSLHAIFSTRKQAEEYCRLHNPRALLVEEMDEIDKKEDGVWNWDHIDVYRIKEMPLDPPFAERPVGELAFRVFITRDGTYATAEDAAYEGYNGYRERHTRFYSREDKITDWHEEWVEGAEENQQPLCGHDVMETWVLATDKEHAIKIVSEKRAELIALGRWTVGLSGYIRPGKEFVEEKVYTDDDL